MPATSRLILTLLLCLGILLPKVGTALAMALPGGIQTIVICTGDGMTTIQLGPDGAPLSETQVTEEPCTLGNIVVAEPQPLTIWQELSQRFDTATALHAQPHPALRLYDRRRPARAPPSLTV